MVSLALGRGFVFGFFLERGLSFLGHSLLDRGVLASASACSVRSRSASIMLVLKTCTACAILPDLVLAIGARDLDRRGRRRRGRSIAWVMSAIGRLIMRATVTVTIVASSKAAPSSARNSRRISLLGLESGGAGLVGLARLDVAQPVEPSLDVLERLFDREQEDEGCRRVARSHVEDVGGRLRVLLRARQRAASRCARILAAQCPAARPSPPSSSLACRRFSSVCLVPSSIFFSSWLLAAQLIASVEVEMGHDGEVGGFHGRHRLRHRLLGELRAARRLADGRHTAPRPPSRA